MHAEATNYFLTKGWGKLLLTVNKKGGTMACMKRGVKKTAKKTAKKKKK
jgi:hypothetical protein